jgi:hypothetical protein
MHPFYPDKDIINSHEHARVFDLHDLIFTRVRYERYANKDRNHHEDRVDGNAISTSQKARQWPLNRSEFCHLIFPTEPRNAAGTPKLIVIFSGVQKIE